ncbi:hypothetical protein [Clostridium formicaceticum]|uniref:Uncharacterized protein n=1 Tax=Clostridium formicaceticum TaxID=1497 RepID=A0AAC9RM33_9CLOT|nr:hypothetical protein [Clostridium formicaceticum]AOY75270.1 hypothetical protein BJL90_04725 [Clostridium formicaceticum]ARE89706.1 hypothetical protein CLFO_41870 [Clostridium formicaceticum]
MTSLEKAIERIRGLECPTGDLEKRLAGIFEDYEIANKNEVTIHREEELDRDGAEAYSARLLNNNEASIVVLARSGLDDYVAKVIDAYIN